MSLTAPERETVVTYNDEDETARVTTHQRPVINNRGDRNTMFRDLLTMAATKRV